MFVKLSVCSLSHLPSLDCPGRHSAFATVYSEYAHSNVSCNLSTVIPNLIPDPPYTCTSNKTTTSLRLINGFPTCSAQYPVLVFEALLKFLPLLWLLQEWHPVGSYTLSTSCYHIIRPTFYLICDTFRPSATLPFPFLLLHRCQNRRAHHRMEPWINCLIIWLMNVPWVWEVSSLFGLELSDGFFSSQEYVILDLDPVAMATRAEQYMVPRSTVIGMGLLTPPIEDGRNCGQETLQLLFFHPSADASDLESC